MSHLTRNDYATALSLLAQLERAPCESTLLAAMLRGVAGFIACEKVVLVLIRFEPATLAPPPPASAPATLTAVLDEHGDGLVCLEVRRVRTGFALRDRERLALLQPHLAYLYRQVRRQPGPPPVATQPPWPIRIPEEPSAPAACGLTSREADVMRWVSCGKTDADIAALLEISKRTVHKHLEHIYVKLGVETRTAAVMVMGRRGAGSLTGS